MSIAQIQKPLEDLAELLHSMGLSLGRLREVA